MLQGFYGPLTDRQRDRLEKVLRNGRNLLDLINDILDLSKIEAGRLDLEPAIVRVPKMISEVVETFEPMVKAKGLKLYVELEDNLPPLYVDPLRLRQILTNLLSNAVKFTHEGWVRLKAVRVMVRDGLGDTMSFPARGWLEDGQWVVFSVADTGIGIPVEYQADIFDEFRQVDSSPTREYEGTGLGLAITKKLVEIHHGRIWLKSAVGEGSTFYVALRTEMAPEDAQPQPETQDVCGEGKGDLVLIIDDDPEAADILATYLEDAGYRTRVASDGRAGIEMARALKPVVITVDIMMPEMDGWEVIERLKMYDETSSIPIVVVSIVNNRPLGFSLGVSAHVRKPISRDELLDAMRRVCRASPEKPILVVDDNPDDIEILRAFLEGEGFKIETCSGGEEAIAWLRSNKPGLVLLDLMMPHVSGFDVLGFIRGREDLADVPVIIVSARELDDKDREFLNDRITAVIQKRGLTQDTLLEGISQALGAR